MDELSPVVRDYAWGSTTALPRLLGTEPTGGPQAELWVGAHASAPSVVAASGVPLTQVIAADPTATLGPRVARDHGELPYLLKILAAEQPLSLQVHPTSEQAREGFERENALGLGPDAPTRNYKDRLHKPELVLALTPFEALSGFREPETAAASFRWLADHVAEARASAAAARIASALEADGEGGPAPLREATTLLLSGDPDIERLATAGPERIQDLIASSAEDASVEHPGQQDPALPLLPRVAALHPGDVGVLVTLLLNHVRLAPGEAMALPAGNIHAYIEGVGVEIMANSDNVLRGGLTSKHVDAAELVRIVDFTPVVPRRVMPFSPVPGLDLYLSGFEEFDLARLTHAEAPVQLPGDGPAAIVVTEGEITLTAADGTQLRLGRGCAAFVPASDEPVTAQGSVDLDAYVAVTDLGTYVDQTGL